MKVLFCTPRSWNPFSALIRWWMGTDYSHAVIKFNLYGKAVVCEAGLRGVVINNWANFAAKYKIVDAIDIKNNEIAKEAIKYCIDNLGDDYSYLAILGIALQKELLGKDGEKSFICSELIARALELKHENIDQITVSELKNLLRKRG